MENKMKKITLLTSLILILASCSKTPRYARGEFVNLDKKVKEMNAFRERLLANNEADSCAMDEVTLGRVTDDIKLLQNNNLPVSKTLLNGMDLSKFHPNEAYYLEKNKEWIFPANMNFAGCSDLSCVFTKIYPESNGLEGYINYYFFLKMGYALSTALPVPGVRLDPPRFTEKDILFSTAELKNFYYLTKALPSSFQKMTTLSSLHRMPINTSMPDTPEAPTRSTACGLAGGYTNKGWIVLMDKCLTREKTGLFAGNFFPLVTHELSHRLDYTLTENKQAFSETMPWRELSGWGIVENTDASGKSTRTWIHSQMTANNLPPDGFVRDYAATSPAEDFADTIGYSRFTPEAALGKSPRKFAWISKNVFGGRAYSANGLSEYYVQNLVDLSLKDMTIVINACVGNQESYQSAVSDEILLAYKDYDPALIKCIFGGIERSIALGVKDLKKNDPEACSFFAANEAGIKNNSLTQMSDFIKKDLNKNVEIGKQLLILADFSSTLNESIDPREIFIKCQDPASVPTRTEGETPASGPMECFTKEISAEFNLVAESFKDKIPNQLSAYETSYLGDNSYINTRDRVLNLFGLIFSGVELKFKEQAKKQWKQCMEESPEVLAAFDLKEATFYPYDGGAQYIKKSLLNCLNNSSEETLYSILERAGKKLGLSLATASTKNFVLNMYLTNFTSTLQDFVMLAKNAEASVINEKKNTVTQKVVSSLTNDLNWMGTESKTSRDYYSLCQDKTKEGVEKELESTENAQYTFHAPNNLWNDSICSTVMNSPKVTKQIEALQTKLAKSALPKLPAQLLVEAAPFMAKCKNQFTKNTTLIIKSRNLCLTNPLSWGALEEQAVNAWMRKENIGYITFAEKLGSDYLAQNRTALKDQAIKKMNEAK